MGDEIRFAVLFGRLLELVRSGRELVDDEKSWMEALERVAAKRSLTVHVTDGQLYVDAVPIGADTPFATLIVQQLAAHNLSGVCIAYRSPALDLLRLVEALAEEPHHDPHALPIGARLAASGAVSVFVVSTDEARAADSHRTVRVSEALEIVRGSGMESDERLRPAPEVTAAREARQREEPVARPHEPPHSPTSLMAKVEELRGIGAGQRLMAGLDAFQRALDKTIAKDDVPQIVDAMLVLLRLEEESESADTHRAYGVAVRRALTTDLLRRLVPMLLDELFAADVLRIIRRAGADGTRLIAQQLTEAPTFAERRAYMQALRQIGEGADVIASLLRHDEWFVVRNAADLVGDLRLVEAVPLLGRVADHEDARVRTSVAIALARIGTPDAVRFLRPSLRDPDRAIRLAVARELRGAGTGALAMVLVSAVDVEEDVEVAAEFYRALGRIGTPEAVQALIGVAQSSKGLLSSRKTLPRRFAAIEGLGLAGSPAAVTALRDLMGDRDRYVREAAEAALEMASRQ
jgi:HEAT repeat protein